MNIFREFRELRKLSRFARAYCQNNIQNIGGEQTDFQKAYTEFVSRIGKRDPSLNADYDRLENQTFASLLRHSKFMDLGDPENKIVSGTIFHIVDNDLYIDFGWKFYCVCTRPKKRSEEYIRGANVKLLVKKLELASKFLGFEKDLTLLEADCVLLGLNERMRLRS